ncbi:hypothetical protein V5T82_11110 [Magnetovibrio sp. PR-2]|uniref:hypothetical protein n=1 Tax=Magnetovibrio sp. PR-2 TaxID=3120356 RepID=UPI002FCE473B
MTQAKIPPVAFTVDADNIIIDVNDQWDLFAIENDADGLVHAHVIGQPLLKYVTGDSTRMFVEVMLQGARVRNTIISKPYRCDSPDLKRALEMRIIPLDNHEVRLENHIVSLQTVAQPVHFIGHATPSSDRVKRCSMCNKVELDQEWRDPLDGSVAQSFLDPSSVKVYYGVCDPCQGMGSH